MDIAESTRQNLPVRLLPTAALILGLVHSGMAWSQSDPGYVERQRQMTELHVIALVERWRHETGVPGAVVAVVEGSDTLLLEGFGLADTGAGVPVNPTTTIFRVGSLVRILTATATLHLAEQGAIDLDSDVSQHAGLEALAHGSFGPSTPAQLLLHTAGIDQRTIATRARTPDDLVALHTYIDRRMPPRIRPPGLVSVASIHGYALIGRLVESISGETFDSHLETALLVPLGMSSTAVSPDTIPLERIATGYRRHPDGLIAVSPDHPQTAPASTLATTAADMAKWMRMILGGGTVEGRQVLSTTSIELLLERQFTHHESLAGRTLAFKEGSYLSPRELYLASTGNGFSAVMVLLPFRRVGLFAAFNSEVDFWDLVYQILDPFDTSGEVDEAPSEAASIWSSKEIAGFWQDAAVSQATAEKLVSLVRQDRIRGAEDGSLIWRSRVFEPSGSHCFQERRALTRLCVVEGAGSKRYAAIGDLVLQKLAWYEARPFQVTLWVAFTALFLAAAWPRAPLPRPHSALRPDDPFSPRWPRSLARFAAALNFAFIASLAVVLAIALRTGSSTLLYGIPAYALVVLSLPLVAAALTLIAVAGLVPLWRSPPAGLEHRFRLTLLILALVAFLPFLWSWNLLGFHL